MTVEIGAITRAMRRMAHGEAIDLEKRQHKLGFDQLGEIEQQFQVLVSGTAREQPGWTKFDLAFDVDFFFAPEQRDSPLTTPHFSFGPVVSGDNETPIGIWCSVVKWNVDDRGAYIGATVAVAALTADSTEVDFDGYVHLVFQGFGAPSENDPALDVGQ